jgi:hypothetical protein
MAAKMYKLIWNSPKIFWIAFIIKYNINIRILLILTKGKIPLPLKIKKNKLFFIKYIK